MILIIILVVLCGWPELRLSTGGLVYTQFSEGMTVSIKGYPRAIELITVLLFFLSIPTILKNILNEKYLLIFIGCLIMIALVRVYHGTWFDDLRAGIIIPMLAFLAVNSYPLGVKKFKTILVIIQLATISSCVFMILQPLYGINLDNDAYMAVAPSIGHYRYVGLGQSLAYQSAYLLYSLSISIACALNREDKINQILAFISIAIGMPALLLTGARTGYISAILMILYVLYVLIFRGLVSPRKTIGAIILVLFMMVLSLVYLQPAIDTFVFRASVINTGYRLLAWENALDVIYNNPFLGVANYLHSIKLLRLNMIAHAQNTYLGLAIYAGVICAITYFLCLFKLFSLIKDNKEKIIGKSFSFSTARNLILINFMVFSFSEILTSSVQAQLVLFLILGILHSHKKTEIESNYSIHWQTM